MYELLRTTIKPYFGDHMVTLEHYLSQLWCGVWIKGALAAVMAFYIDVLHGDWLALDLYLIITILDLVLGALIAHLKGTFQRKYLLYWVRKLLTYALIISLIGILGYMTHISFGKIVYSTNWAILLCTLTEISSVIRHLRDLGCPIPPVLDVFFKFLGRHTSKKITEACGGDEQMEEELTNVINPDRRSNRRE